MLFIRDSCLKDKQLINSTVVRSLNDSEKGFMFPARKCGHFDAASRQHSVSHCHLCERTFDQKVYFSGSVAPIIA